MNKEKLKNIKQELMKLQIFTKKRQLSVDEFNLFSKRKHEIKKVFLEILDIQGNVNKTNTDAQNCSSDIELFEDENQQPFKEIWFKGLEQQEVDDAMNNLENYFNEYLIEIRKALSFENYTKSCFFFEGLSFDEFCFVL
jgi:hypothetical protein